MRTTARIGLADILRRAIMDREFQRSLLNDAVAIGERYALSRLDIDVLKNVSAVNLDDAISAMGPRYAYLSISIDISNYRDETEA
jgi:hypothetical protein